MKHLLILFLILFLVALRFDSAQAQTTPNVCRAQLFFADINTQGSLVISGNALVFIDDRPVGGWPFERPTGDSEALSIDKSNILDTNRQSGIFSVYTRNLVPYRSRLEKHITFRFISGNCDPIVRWPGGKPPVKPKLARTPRPSKLTLNIRAKLRRSMRPDAGGNLIISIPNDMITFGNRGEGRYQWGPRDLRDIQLEGSCVLRVTPFVGGELTFDLQECIGPPHFKKVRERFLR